MDLIQPRIGYTIILKCIHAMGVIMQVAKWGNSLAVRLPASVVDALGLKEGDDIEIYAADSGAFSVSKKPTVAERIERLRKYRGRLPADFKFDRESLSDRDNVE
ncbi:transcriptional regulator/antitoxin MazE [Burkholderia sp. SJ98]|nr:transcriptional regulator/antitoxin MazE [Burkholderia sp. SJ98]